jgi:adenylate cyclase
MPHAAPAQLRCKSFAFALESTEEFDGLAVGVGVATGSVIHGMIGSARRADFTVIGDSVNVASRLCGIAKGMQIIVSDATKEEAGTDFLFKGTHLVSAQGNNEKAKKSY